MAVYTPLVISQITFEVRHYLGKIDLKELEHPIVIVLLIYLKTFLYLYNLFIYS